jgi:hypothetical protein
MKTLQDRWREIPAFQSRSFDFESAVNTAHNCFYFANKREWFTAAAAMRASRTTVVPSLVGYRSAYHLFPEIRSPLWVLGKYTQIIDREEITKLVVMMQSMRQVDALHSRLQVALLEYPPYKWNPLDDEYKVGTYNLYKEASGELRSMFRHSFAKVINGIVGDSPTATGQIRDTSVFISL